MPPSIMNPKEQDFNEQLIKDHSFCTLNEEVFILREGQQEIKATLKAEQEKQESFETYVKEEFKNGSKKFDKLESEIENMKEDYRKGVKQIVEEIKNKELSNLREEIRNTKAEKEERKQFWMGVAKAVLSGVVIAIVLYGLSKIGLVKP